MNKYTLGKGILIIGIVLVVGNFPSELSSKELQGPAIGIVVCLIGIMYMSKHKRWQETSDDHLRSFGIKFVTSFYATEKPLYKSDWMLNKLLTISILSRLI